MSKHLVLFRGEGSSEMNISISMDGIEIDVTDGDGSSARFLVDKDKIGLFQRTVDEARRINHRMNSDVKRARAGL